MNCMSQFVLFIFVWQFYPWLYEKYCVYFQVKKGTLKSLCYKYNSCIEKETVAQCSWNGNKIEFFNCENDTAI